MNDIYEYSASIFGTSYSRFFATKEDGDKIIDELKKRVKEKHDRELQFIVRPIAVVTFESFFEER